MSERAVENPSEPLPYAPVRRSRARRWLRPRYLVLFALVVAGTIVYGYRDELSLRARRQYWAWQCMRYRIPPDAVMVESDPAKAAALLAANPDYVARKDKGVIVAAVFFPRCLREFQQVDATSRTLRAMSFALDGSGAPILFLHERTSPAGHRRLVVVSGDETNALRLSSSTDHVAVVPPSLFEALPLPSGPRSQPFRASGRYEPARLSPAVPDPHDPSHFWIDFAVVDWTSGAVRSRGTLDGYLRDDGRVEFSIRDPATTQPKG